MKSKKIFLTLTSFMLLTTVGKAQEKINYSPIQKLSCLTQPRQFHHSQDYEKGAIQAHKALKKRYDSVESVWFQETIKREERLRFALEDYLAGKRGQSAKKLTIKGKKSEDLHKELIAAGFHHKRLPLSAYSYEQGKNFWRRDGTKTSDKNDSQVMPMDVYYHVDGSLVRIKPEGIPSPKHPRPEPDAVKAVVYDLTLITDKTTGQKVLDTRSRNEAFKISEAGAPLPKGPSSKVGMRLLYTRKQLKEMDDPQAAKAEQKGWIDTIMQETHLALKADYSHCATKSTEDK